MNYALLNADGTFNQGLTDDNFQFSPTVFQPPATLTQEQMIEFHVVPYSITTTPNLDWVTQTYTEDTPIQINGVWTQQWKISSLPPETIAANQALIEQKRIESLWQSAHDVEFNTISGSAIGLITMGVLQGKPKCLAVQAWLKTLWTEYYTRKATGSTNYDFSAYDNCPHTVPEIMQELGV